MVSQKTSLVLFTGLTLCVAQLLCAQTEAPPTSTSPAAATQTVAASPVQTARNANIGTPTPAPADASKTPAAGPKKPTTDAKKRYVIGPLDVLDIKVWGQNQLTGAVAVDRDGMISLPLVGEIKADGMTSDQLRDTIQSRLKDCCLNTPEVETSVLKINSKRYYVYGGVLKPGPYPLAEATTIMDALSEVGFKDFANLKKITIQRGEQTFKFNYNDFQKGKNKDKNLNIELQNGDRIYVPE